MWIAYILVLLMLLLNVWVWFFPNSFIGFVNRGKGAKMEHIIPSLREIWGAIDSPRYIWFPRFGFGLGLIISLVMVYELAIAR